MSISQIVLTAIDDPGASGHASRDVIREPLPQVLVHGFCLIRRSRLA